MGVQPALPYLFGGRLPKFGSKVKHPRFSDERGWAAAVVKKATPSMVKALAEAAELLGEPARAPQRKPASPVTEEPKDESLAAFLLRLLRSAESAGKENSGTSAAATKENSSVG